MRRNDEEGAEKDDEGARSSGLLAGGYYWLPAPGHPTICWDVVTCHQLGFDAEVGHVDMWTAVIDQLATAWDKDPAVLRLLLKDRCHGLPRERITRPGKRFLILHGNDSLCPDWLERVILSFHLDRRSVKALFDDHERMLAEDRARVSKALGIHLGQIRAGSTQILV